MPSRTGSAIFALYLLVTIPFLVESPRWLANYKGIAQATAVIARLKGTSEDNTQVQEIRREIETVLEEERSNDWRDIFTTGGESRTCVS
ncbi:hypothetical protein VTN96DRAFT_325 [Rasamsonia emersonii]